MSRDRSNCSTIDDEPTPEREVISDTPAIVPRCRSSGAATLEAIVDGLAPGRFACTMIVGKSTCGSGATGSMKNAPTPASISPIVSRIVPTGRRMKGAEMFTPGAPRPRCRAARASRARASFRARGR